MVLVAARGIAGTVKDQTFEKEWYKIRNLYLLNFMDNFYYK